MKVSFVNLRGISNMSLKNQFRLQCKRYWQGKIIHLGTWRYYMVIDKRGINSFQDLADALAYPKSWYLIKKMRKLFKLTNKEKRQ